jgi:WD40 repeat protein
VTASFDKTVKLWGLDGKLKTPPLPPHPVLVWDASISPDGKFMVSAGRDGYVRLWPMSMNHNNQQPLELKSLIKIGCQRLSDLKPQLIC